MFKRFLPYLLLLLLSLLPRFLYLGTVPVSLSHDEVDMVIQAHSVRQTGTDLSGTWRPWQLRPNDAVMAELGPLVNVPLLSLLPNSLFAAHATTALLSSLYPLLLVLLLRSWGFPNRLPWLAGFFLALSPWHILFSRTSLEQPTSLFFYTLSWLLLARLFQTKRFLTPAFIFPALLFILTYLLGFYTYHGYKFALPLVTLIIAAYHSYRQRLLLPLVLVTLVVGGLYARLFLSSSAYQSRGSEIVFLDESRFSAVVDQDRRISLLPGSLTRLLSNKPLAQLTLLTDKYLALLSPTQLFATGEHNGVFATGRTGYLYLFLLPFMLVGFTRLLTTPKPPELLTLVLFVVSPISTLIHRNDSFAFRSAFFLVLSTLIAAIGVDYLHKLYPRAKVRVFVLFLSVLGFLHFGYIYFGFYPVESSRAYFFSDRLLATYLSHRPQPPRILVIDPQPRYVMSYLALTQPDVSLETLAPLRGQYNIDEAKNSYTLGNLTIRRDCPGAGERYDSVIVDSTLVDGLARCEAITTLTPPVSTRKIADPLDSGGRKIIYNDQICQDTLVPPYLRPDSLHTFALTQMSRVQFCSSWIIEN